MDRPIGLEGGPIYAAQESEMKGIEDPFGVDGIDYTCIQSVPLNASFQNLWPISSLHYDIWEDLVWSGSEQGVVKSFFGPNMERYTSYVAHKGPVRCLNSIDGGILSVGGDSIQFRTRGGVLKWTTTVPKAGEVCSMAISTATAEAVISTQASQLACVNLYRGTVQKQWLVASPVTKLASTHHRSVCCANLVGELALLDFRDLKSSGRKLKAFYDGTVLDMSVADYLVATTGVGANGIDPDTAIKFFDIRKWVDQPVLEARVPEGARLVQWDPSQSSSLLVSRLDGHAQFISSQDGLPSSPAFPVDLYSPLSAMDVSALNSYACFGSLSGMLHQWGHEYCSGSEPFNVMSRPTEGPALYVSPRVCFDVIDESVPLSAVGMPYYTTRLFSAFDKPPYHRLAPPAPLIPNEVVALTKVIDYVGYAINPEPKLYRRNQSYPLSDRINKALFARTVDTPKFRSQQVRDKLFRKDGGSAKAVFPPETANDSISSEAERQQLVGQLPKHYEPVKIEYSKFGVNDFDFAYYNKTVYSGLEPVYPNGYMNSILQVLRFIEPLVTVLVSHCRGGCLASTCLSCSLGFLFQMLADARGLNCQAQNFCKTFSTLPQALALGLLGPELSRESVLYSQMLQKCARFLLEQVKLDLNGRTASQSHVALANPKLPPPSATEKPDSSLIDAMFGIHTEILTTCACGKRQQRTTSNYSLELSYPLKVPTDGRFCELVQGSLMRTSGAKAWCAKCKKYNSMTQTRKVCQTPPYMLVGCGVLSASCQRVDSNDDSAHNVGGSVVASSELEAARLWWRIEPQSHGLASGLSHSKHPSASAKFLPQRFAIKTDRKQRCVKVGECEDDFSGDEIQVYELQSTIVEVKSGETQPRHLAAHCLLDNATEDGSKSWYLFNDFLVQEVEPVDVLSFKENKVPVLLVYKQVDFKLSVDPWLEASDVSILLNDTTVLNPYTRIQSVCQPLLLEELKAQDPGMLIAIDAEFVCTGKEEKEIRSDKSHRVIRPTQYSLARLSVVRGDGRYAGTPLIDDYVVIREPIVDYLTEFSGIQPTDCDPLQSTHSVVPLKSIEKKIRCLIDLGCKFLGHMIVNDFRSVNMVVPKEHIIDTGDIYYIPEKQRRLSLKYLCWYLLNKNIQEVTHDSIEDAKSTLEIYQMYLYLKEKGFFEQVLSDIYAVGQPINFKPVFPKTIRTLLDTVDL